MRVSTKNIDTIHEEEERNRYFRPQCIEVKEEEREINETKSPEWMNAKIKTNEVDISINEHPKLAKTRDY